MLNSPPRASLWRIGAALAAVTAGLFSVTSAGGAPHAGAATAPAPSGYWLMTLDGAVSPFGAAGQHGGMSSQPLNKPTVCMTSTVDGGGYWQVASDGGVFTFGNAGFYGSMGGSHLNEPVIGMAANPAGSGYWEVASDGGIFTFGDAGFYGSTGAMHLNQPVVGMAPTPSGHGYWLVASDGGIFTFGDAGFYGSMGAHPLNQPVVGMAATQSGNGYWLVASDGGIFTFGDAGFYGSMGAHPLNQPVIGMARTPSGNGYWLAAKDGGIFTFGDAPFSGSLGAAPPANPVVAIDVPGEAGGCLGTASPDRINPPGGGGPPGEGQWSPTGRYAGSTPPVYTTVLRPYVGGPVASIAWIDTGRVRLRQYAGVPGQPPGSFANSWAVGYGDRSTLAAAFNGGFKVAESRGGWYSEGQTPYPLANWAASLVIDNAGIPRVGMWGRDFASTAGLSSVRQNLTMLVDHGAAAPDIETAGDWGAVTYGVVNNCRSGVGTDKYGNLLFVAGQDLYPHDLAHLLIQAGALEAMELDINCQWPQLTAFSGAGAANIAGWFYYGPGRYISGSTRDFFAVFIR